MPPKSKSQKTNKKPPARKAPGKPAGKKRGRPPGKRGRKPGRIPAEVANPPFPDPCLLSLYQEIADLARRFAKAAQDLGDFLGRIKG